MQKPSSMVWHAAVVLRVISVGFGHCLFYKVGIARASIAG